MKLIACVDDNNGLLFNNRRQSRDSVVIDKIYEIAAEGRLWIHSFSEKLFPVAPEVNDDFLELAKDDDYCFIENVKASSYIDKIQAVYLFRWNRNYPYDFTFDIDLEEYFTLNHIEEIKGNSHDDITMEVWTKC